MDKTLEIDDIVKSMTIFPKFVHYIMGTFKPQLTMDIKKNEITTLFELSIHPNMPMKHYVETVDMESGSFTYLADRLQEKGLIKRVQSEDDKRQTVLSLTEAGVVLTEEMKTQFNAHISDLISVLDTEDLKILSDAVASLEKIFAKIV
jgi:DNA-binding MarR family transcriptional regulator